MDNLTLIQSLDEAIRIISAARTAGKLASGSSAIWRIADHAENHLDKQIKDLLAPPAETAAPALVDHLPIIPEDGEDAGIIATINRAMAPAALDLVDSHAQ
jgi:hypothetical protein